MIFKFLQGQDTFVLFLNKQICLNQATCNELKLPQEVSCSTSLFLLKDGRREWRKDRHLFKWVGLTQVIDIKNMNEGEQFSLALSTLRQTYDWSTQMPSAQDSLFGLIFRQQYRLSKWSKSISFTGRTGSLWAQSPLRVRCDGHAGWAVLQRRHQSIRVHAGGGWCPAAHSSSRHICTSSSALLQPGVGWSLHTYVSMLLFSNRLWVTLCLCCAGFFVVFLSFLFLGWRLKFVCICWYVHGYIHTHTHTY